MSLDHSPSSPIAVGFLTVLQESSGWLGGYLVTNGWGRPLEFRLTTAVQPNRVQAALYGATLNEYLFADLIGKTLVEKTATKPQLVVTDSAAAPAVAIARRDAGGGTQSRGNATQAAARSITRAAEGLAPPALFATDRDAVMALSTGSIQRWNERALRTNPRGDRRSAEDGSEQPCGLSQETGVQETGDRGDFR